MTFQKGLEIVISFAGTNPSDLSGDMVANVGLATGVGSDQLRQAAEYYLQVQAANPEATITFTGHSLGGGLAALMGVFFGKHAVTFDQAPFANSAEVSLILPDVAANLKIYLLERSYREDELQGLTDFLNVRAALPLGEIPNSSLVTSINVDGEFLSGVPYNVLDRIGPSASIPTHAPGVSGDDLHSIALLTLFLQSMKTAPSGQTLNGVTFKLTDLMEMVFSRDLYRFDTDTPNQNFLERLVQNETGNVMVTRFTNDLWKLAQDGGLTMADDSFAAVKLVSQTLIAFAMQKYYTETQASAGYQQELFTSLSADGTGTGGIRFDLADVAANLTDTKGYTLYFHNYLANAFTPGDRDQIESVLPGLRDWYVQAGVSGMNATDTQNRGAFLLGGIGGDTLTGGAGADLLVGNTGGDRLNGGGGNDTLLGGAGFDIYSYAMGDGHDRIEDSDARGAIFLNSHMLVGGIKKAGQADWVSSDGTLTYRMSGTDLMVELNGSSIMTVNENFQSGQFGIRLIDRSSAPTDTPPVVDYANGFTTEVLYANEQISGSVVLGGFGDNSQNYVIHGYEGEEDWHFNQGNIGSNQLFTARGNDVVFTAKGHDRISGGEGNDILWSGDGDDVVRGDEGDDVLKAGRGRDFLDGGAGNDIVLAGSGKDVVLGGEGADLLFGDGLTPDVGGEFGPGGSVGDPALMDDDYLDGQSGADWLFGFLGDDVLMGGEGADHLFGDIVPDDSPAIQTLYTSATFYYGLVAFESSDYWFTTVEGGADYLDGGDGNDILQGDGGNDILLGGSQDDTLIGDDGSMARVQQGDDLLDGGDGDDLLLGGGGDDILSGGEGNDQLIGDYLNASGLNQGRDILDGGGGNDLLFGGGGDDVLNGGVDNDELQGGDGFDTLFGGLGNDRLFGDDKDDRLFGDGGDDELYGGEGNDVLLGDAGNDQLFGGDGFDELFGGDGVDTLNGGEGNDVLDGGIGNNILFGEAGDDRVLGGVGHDDLFGGTGQDHIDGGAGIDYIEGGTGNDMIYGGTGDDRIYGDVNPNLAPPNSFPIGGDDVIDGGEGNDDLRGGLGNDTLFGGVGHDLLIGGDGDDILNGGVGNDTLLGGGTGADVIHGGEGNDALYAGTRASSGGGGEGSEGGDGFVALSMVVQTVDQLFGDEGDDYLNSGNEYFNTNDSRLVGGVGNDIFVIDGVADVVVEEAEEGIDTVETFINYSLPDHVENLTFAGLPGLVGVGNALDNVMRGQGQGTLDGGAGNDILIDAQIYRFGRGSGQDMIIEQDTSSAPYFAGGPQDIIQLAADLAPTDVSWNRSGNDLVLTITDSMDRITIPSFYAVALNQGAYRFSPNLYYPETTINVFSVPYYVAPSQIEAVKFSDGTVWTASEFNATQLGSYDANTYVFGRGDGIDAIVDFDFTAEQTTDVLQMRAGVLPEDVIVNRVGDDLVLGLAGTADQLTIESYFASVFVVPPFASSGRTVQAYRVELIQFADGTFWDATLIAGMVPTLGTDADDFLLGTSQDNEILGLGGHDALLGLEGNDQLEGGAGNDYLEGNEGTDLLDGGTGFDTLRGGAGHDTYFFNIGDGIDTIMDVATAGEGNRIQFGVGITQSDLRFAHDESEQTLFIQVGSNGADQLVLTNFDPTGTNGSLVVGTLGFADGTEVVLTRLLGPRITVSGTDNGDVIGGTVGDDGIDAGSGDDTVYGNAGNDLILAGAGIDSVAGDEGADVIFGGSGTDYLYGGEGDDAINGEEGHDVVVGDAGNDALSGGDGNDTLNGGAGADQLSGGEGADTLYIDAADIVVSGGAGYDAVTVVGTEAVIFDAAGAEVEFVAGNSGNDVVTAAGSVAGVTFYGGEGDDHLIGGDGNDVLVGQAGADTLTGGSGNDVLNGGNGDDHLSGELGDDTFYAGAGNDQIAGGEGSDSVSGDEGADVIFGGSGTDYLYGGEGDDAINGEEGHDVVVGDAGNDALSGGDGNDTLNGGAGADQLSGGEGADTLYIDAADIVISGGAGYDAVTVVGTEAVIFDAAGAEVEFVAGNSGNDVVTAAGSVTGVTFYGGEGDDHLIGGDGNDVLVGQAGADTLTGGSGSDVLNGGNGDDHLSGELGNDMIYGGTGNDRISGGDGDDSVSGEDGVDTILGGSGGDYLSGGDGDDVISGDDGNDTLVGHTGDDTIAGGVGNDYLAGGTGNDVYLFTEGDEVDTISEDDATVGNADRLAFGTATEPLDLILSRQANDLRVAIHGTRDQVAIENWYLGEAHHVETIQAGNGQALFNTQVDQLIHAMAAFTEQTGLTWDQAIDQRPQDVQAVLTASWQ
ncbi:MAG: calcium-binding protein [Nitrospira sp.]